MKRKIKWALGLVCVGCIFAACIVTDEAGDPCLVNYVLLGAAFAAGTASKLLWKREVRRG